MLWCDIYHQIQDGRQKMVKKMLKILFFANSLWAQALMVYDDLHNRCHFIERHVPTNKNQVINAWLMNN